MTDEDVERHDRWLAAFKREKIIGTMHQARSFAIVAVFASLSTAFASSVVTTTRWDAVLALLGVEVSAAIVFLAVWWRAERKLTWSNHEAK